MRRAAAALLLLVVALSGCGGSSHPKVAQRGPQLCQQLGREVRGFQAANAQAEQEAGNARGVLTSLEGVRSTIKGLMRHGTPLERQRAEFIDTTLGEWEAEGEASLIEHLTGEQPWKPGVPKLSEVCG